MSAHLSSTTHSFQPHRRDVLRGLGAMATASLVPGVSVAARTQDSPRVKGMSLPGIAKRVLMITLPGGPSQLDTFDYKPRLVADHGRPGREPGSKLLAPRWSFAQHGASGQWISSLLPNLAAHADELCVIRSLRTEAASHTEALLALHTGETSGTAPSLGARVVRVMGIENSQLPGFVAITPPTGFGGARQYSAATLPAICRGARLGNDQYLPTSLKTAPVQETEATLRLYGVGNDLTDAMGRKCLAARQLLEQGVRFVSLTHGSWDHHANLTERMEAGCIAIDRPLAGLLQDLAARGLLAETLVVCAGEFGRTPHAEGNNGRDHQSSAFTAWLAGGGIAGGTSIGRTDDYGYEVVESAITIQELHERIYWALGCVTN